MYMCGMCVQYVCKPSRSCKTAFLVTFNKCTVLQNHKNQAGQHVLPMTDDHMIVMMRKSFAQILHCSCMFLFNMSVYCRFCICGAINNFLLM